MAGVVNIRRDVSDRFYRYKMPKILSKIEGKGNGIKTVVPNMTDIAKALDRPPAYPTKFFGIELGAQVKCDAANDRYIINGAHDAEKLATILDAFIAKFVLCPSCKNPETELQITKDEVIMRNCKACGAILPCDMAHKLGTFILKNASEVAAAGKKKSKSKKAASATSIATATITDNGSRPDSGDEEALATADAEEDAGMGDDELTARIEKEAAALRLQDRTGDDDDWVEDTSEEAVAARMKELAVSGAVAKLMGADADADEGADDDDPSGPFADFVCSETPRSDAEIKEKAKELGLRSDKVLTVLASTLWNEAIIAEKQVEARAKFFSTFVKNEKCQRALLGGIERLVGYTHPDLMPKVPLILKALYDEELVEEDTFLTWSDKPSKKYVDRKIAKEIRTKAAPFITWLREADSDDDEEDDE